MKPFSVRAGSRKGITPNNRTGVKRRGTGLSCRNDEGRVRGVQPAHLSSFCNAELRECFFFFFFCITRQELCSPLSSSKTFSLKFNWLDLGQPLSRMFPSWGMPIWTSLFMGRITHQETFKKNLKNFKDLRNLFSVFQLKQLMARWTHPFTQKPRG